MRVLSVVSSTGGDRVGEWMGSVGSLESGSLGWCILDGDQSMVELVEVGESGTSTCGLQGWRIQ